MTTTTKLNLTSGGADMLGQLAAAPGLLTKPVDIIRVGRFAEDHLLDIPLRPARDDHPTEKAWIDSMRKWERQELPPIEVTPNTMESLRLLVRTATEKGMLPARPAAVSVMVALGLAEGAE